MITLQQFASLFARRLLWGLLRLVSLCLVRLGTLCGVLGLAAWSLGAPVGHELAVGGLVVSVGLQCAWGWGVWRE